MRLQGLLQTLTAAIKVYTNAYAEHMTMKHTENDYRTVGDHHTNNIEGFWSQLKRGVIGIYHQISPKHLQAYCNEFAFRYNTRKVTDVVRFEDSFKQVNNVRLTYTNLIAD